MCVVYSAYFHFKCQLASSQFNWIGVGWMDFWPCLVRKALVSVCILWHLCGVEQRMPRPDHQGQCGFLPGYYQCMCGWWLRGLLEGPSYLVPASEL